MKRQRNTQQVKEQDKYPPKQTKEEEIGNLLDKEFRIMILKLIQNLENKMELQINSLETRIEKMQEMFNKGLEEIKKSQYIMNTAINEIKNTLGGTNSRITKAEDRISEVEDRMVEIKETQRKQKLKDMKPTSETSETMLNDFILSFLFTLFYNFNFLNLLYFSTLIPLFVFPTILFPLQLIFNVYKFSPTHILHILICK